MTNASRKMIARLLTEVKRIAAHASLTGSLEDGKQVMIDTYNKCLAALQLQPDTDFAEIAALGIFAELPRSASIDEVGVAAALLVSLLQGDKKRRVLPDGTPVPPHVRVVFDDDEDDEDDDDEKHEDDDEDDDWD